MNLTSKQRMLISINGGIPDRLPVTTHHVQPYFLKQYMNGMSNEDFFNYFGLDPILWVCPCKPDESKGEYLGFTPCKTKLIFSDDWRIGWEYISEQPYPTIRYTIFTPKGNLTTIIQSNDYTCWVTERLVKNKKDIELVLTSFELRSDLQYYPSKEINKEKFEFVKNNVVDFFIKTKEILSQINQDKIKEIRNKLEKIKNE